MLASHDELYAIDVNSSGQGWAVGKFGLILHTENGGQSWSRQESGTRRELTAVAFADERHGFAVGGGGTILTTYDGGQSWQSRNAPTKEHLLDIHAVSGKAAFAVGAFGTLLSTQDGGANWTEHELSWKVLLPKIVREIGEIEPNLNTIHFANAKQGWVGGEFGLILHTRDGGATWIVQRAGSHLPQISAIEFRDSFNGWAVGQKGALLKTSDGGKIWQTVAIDSVRDFYGISLGKKISVIVGAGVMLESSSDDSDWASALNSPVDLWFSGVAISRDRALAVGQKGTIHAFALRHAESFGRVTEKSAP